MATQMNNTLTSMLSTSTGSAGVIQNAKDGINKTLKTLGERYDAMDAQIEATMARYKPSSPAGRISHQNDQYSQLPDPTVLTEIVVALRSGYV